MFTKILGVFHVNEFPARESRHLLQVNPVGVGADSEGEDFRVVRSLIDRVLDRVSVGRRTVGQEKNDTEGIFVAGLLQFLLRLAEIFVGLRVEEWNWKERNPCLFIFHLFRIIIH